MALVELDELGDTPHIPMLHPIFPCTEMIRCALRSASRHAQPFEELRRSTLLDYAATWIHPAPLWSAL